MFSKYIPVSRLLRLSLRGNLNDDGIVRVTSGLASLGCFGWAISYFCRGGNNPRVYVGTGAGSIGFGSLWWYLYNKEKEQKRTPVSTPSSTQTIPEQTPPAYMIPFGDSKPARYSLNELARAEGIELRQLVGKYFYEGDIAIFFALANKGKTIAAIQMAIDIASGNASLVPTEKPSQIQNVIYFNFEMSVAQMKKRLNPEDNEDGAFYFPENVDIRDCGGCFDDSESFLRHIAEIAEKEIATDTVMFIDTITDICPQFFSKEASYVLNTLKLIQKHVLLKKKIRLSFLIEAHANKVPIWEPLDMENLKGGFNQANLTDSMFALGMTIDKNQRYIKHVKSRNDPLTDMVDVFEFSSTPYLHFAPVGSAKEVDVLPLKPKANGKGVVTSETVTDDLEFESEWDGKLSLEDTIAMKEYYQPNVVGHGLQPTAEKFGLKHSVTVSRELERLNRYLQDHPEQGITLL